MSLVFIWQTIKHMVWILYGQVNECWSQRLHPHCVEVNTGLAIFESYCCSSVYIKMQTMFSLMLYIVLGSYLYPPCYLE